MGADIVNAVTSNIRLLHSEQPTARPQTADESPSSKLEFEAVVGAEVREAIAPCRPPGGGLEPQALSHDGWRDNGMLKSELPDLRGGSQEEVSSVALGDCPREDDGPTLRSPSSRSHESAEYR